MASKLSSSETADLLYTLRVGVDALRAEAASLKHLREELTGVSSGAVEHAAQVERIIKSRLTRAEHVHSFIEFATIKSGFEVVLAERGE